MILHNREDFSAKKQLRMRQLKKEIRVGKRVWMVNPYGGGNVVECTITSRVVDGKFNFKSICKYTGRGEMRDDYSYIEDAVGYDMTSDGKFDKYIGFSKKSAIMFAKRWVTDDECKSIMVAHLKDCVEMGQHWDEYDIECGIY